MNDAVRLFAALPEWFLISLQWPFLFWPLTAFPILGTICLVIGLTLGIVRRKTRLLLFLIPVALSQILVTTAGIAGEPGFWGLDGLIYIVFFVLQIVLSVYLIFRVQDAVPAAVASALFSVIYALTAIFIAQTAYHFPAI